MVPTVTGSQDSFDSSLFISPRVVVTIYIYNLPIQCLHPSLDSLFLRAGTIPTLYPCHRA